MNAKQKLHQVHLNEWASRFSDQKNSGLTVRQWCEQNQISIHTYNYWKHTLKEELVDQMLPDIVPLSFDASTSPEISTKPESLYSVQTDHTIRSNCSTIHLTINGISFEMDSTISQEFLCSLIKAVRYA